MKTLISLLIFCGANLISYLSYSQINSVPYFQEFEQDFLKGINTEFLPGWTGNEVQSSTRIYKDTENARTGSGALGISPTSGFSGIITVNLNLSSFTTPEVQFYARGVANGSGSYGAEIEFSFSMNHGSTFVAPETLVRFSNSNSEYLAYKYSFPQEVAGKDKIILKIKVRRSSSGTGTAAKVIIDDFNIYNGKINSPKTLTFRQIQINEIFADPTGTYAPDSLVLPNSEFIEIYNAGIDTVNLKNFSITGSKIPEYLLLPGKYLILCPAGYSSLYSSFGPTIGLSTWNTLTNSGEKILLRDSKGNAIDSVEYNMDWYQDGNKKNGGWSLEQMNSNSSCLGKYNWSASVSHIGATPGKKNSLSNASIPEITFTIRKISVIDQKNIQVLLTKPMSNQQILPIKVIISPQVPVDSIMVNSDMDLITITFFESLLLGKQYNLSLSELEDCSRNTVNIRAVPFGLGVVPGFNDIILTEIMANPSANHGLPETEYLELFNKSEKIIALKDISLIDNTSSAHLPDIQIFPSQYIVLCPPSFAASFGKGVLTASPSKWLSLNNAGETLSLKHQDNIIFSISYSSDWYEDNKMKGGYSLEMANTNFSCIEEGNWFASLNAKGGTPGLPNSRFESKIDLKGPFISSAQIFLEGIDIVFNEKITTTNLSKNNFSITPIIEIDAIIPVSDKRVRLKFGSDLSLKTKYTITARNISDCTGNTNSSSYDFAVPERADSFDIIINEVLFNPRPNGVDFVELFNRSDKYISLKGLGIGRLDDENVDLKSISFIQPFLAPGEYLVLTVNPVAIINDYPAAMEKNIIKQEKMPALPDDKGIIVVMDSLNNILDQFEYHQEYHDSFLKKNEGVSLERIDVNKPTNDSNNWHSASTNVGFATPGYKNSQSRTSNTLSEDFSIYPGVFSPDGDGFNDFTLINYRFSEPGNIVSINIFDRNGRIMKELIKNKTLSLEGFVQWNGEDEKGLKVDTGIYIVYIELFNPNGEKRKYKKEVIVAANFK